jgi:hypothetical protein
LSYGLTVKVTNGTAVIDTASGTIPDGTFSISGHEDASYITLSVQRVDIFSNLIGNANSMAGAGAFPKAEVPS